MPSSTSMTRRQFLTGVSVGAVGVVAGSQNASARTLDIAPGEEIGPYLESISDGETIIIPEGTYSYSGGSIAADRFTLRTEGLVTWDVQGEQRLNITGLGWTFGGVNFDIRGERSHMRVGLYGGDWRFHNCAWTGLKTGIGHFINPNCQGGTSGLVDKCYMGDGQADDVGDSYVFTYSRTDGVIEFRSSFFNQGGIYGADTRTPPGQEGTVHLTDCYFRNAYNACMRTGMRGHTARIRNCTAVYDSRELTPDIPEQGTSLSNVGGRSFRGIWGFWSDVLVEDCDVKVPYGIGVQTSNHGNPHVLVRNSEVSAAVRKAGNVTFENVGRDPDVTPPESCVTSAAEAVLGSSDAMLPEPLRANGTGGIHGPGRRRRRRRQQHWFERVTQYVALGALLSLGLLALVLLSPLIVLYLLIR
ncbi:twin-arginine translocation signal domain-containing protein [Halobium palmae]|uniref:Twin-arginine translocation signal domain-containing protein n=1 Tax=Halobium palmae TaxID=1776492 RepID=A0ABD5RW21_9EURY